MNSNDNSKIVEILQSILLSIKNVENNKATLSVKEAALYSGMGHEKIRELLDKPYTDFPFFKVGSRVAINKTLFDNWLKKISEEHRQL